jgi:5-methylcytosine-specific restriction protein A
MKIPEELTSTAYEISKRVYEKKLTLKEGKELLVGANRMNSNSASDYINNFRYLIEGKRFTRTNNAYSMEYYFDKIYKDYGSEGLSNALNALRLHIEYYEGIQKVNMKSMRNIYNKYLSAPIMTSDEQEQLEISKEILIRNTRKEDIVTELKNLKLTDPIDVIINSKTYKRDNRTIAQIKFLRNFKCQICTTSIMKKDGTMYIEAAHIEPKNRKGRETPDNILLLCPNHHKEFDLGDRIILSHNKEKVKFTLNGLEYNLSLRIE